MATVGTAVGRGESVQRNGRTCSWTRCGWGREDKVGRLGFSDEPSRERSGPETHAGDPGAQGKDAKPGQDEMARRRHRVPALQAQGRKKGS